MTTRTDGPDWFHATTDEAGDDDLLDDGQPQRRTNRLTVVLAVAVLGACTFTAGALAQKQFGSPTGTAAGALPAGVPTGQGFPGGGPPSGFPVGEGVPDAPTAGVPVVVGTVRSVEGTRLLVENFAGTRVTVTVPASATVTAPGLGGVTAGMTVSVAGTTAADGTVTATSVTARRPS